MSTRITERLTVVPIWKPVTPRSEGIVIRMDPGPAFWNRLDPNTRDVLESIEDFHTPGHGACSTWEQEAHLAIYAVKLGAARVLAIDSDPEPLAGPAKTLS